GFEADSVRVETALLKLGPMLTRRGFLEVTAAAGLTWPSPEQAAPAPSPAAAHYPVHFRKAAPWDSLARYLEPGHDEFTAEKEAAETTAHLNRLLELRELPLAADFRGASPLPVRYTPISEGVFSSEYDPHDQDFQSGLHRWVTS